MGFSGLLEREIIFRKIFRFLFGIGNGFKVIWVYEYIYIVKYYLNIRER